MLIKEELIASYGRQIAQIEEIKKSQIASITANLTREQIAPFNKEIEDLRVKAEAELNAKLEKDIQKLRENCENKKKELRELGEKKKAKFAEDLISKETKKIVQECDKSIAELNAQIRKIKG